MRMSKEKKVIHKGLVLVLLVLAIAIFAVMAVSMASLGYQSRIRAIRAEQEIAAREAADAGHDAAVFELNRLLDSWTGTLPQQNTPVSLPGGSQTYTYTVAPTAGVPAGLLALDISAVGTAGNTLRTIFSRTVLFSVFNYAILVKDNIDLKAKVVIDGYDSADGTYGGTNSGFPVQIGTNDDDQGDISLKVGVEAPDDSMLIVGSGAIDDPGIVVDDKSDFQGDVVASLVEIPFPDVILSIDGLTNSGQLDVAMGDTVTVTAGAYLYDGIVVNKNATLQLEGDVIINVLSDGVLLKAGAKIIVQGTPDSSLEMYLAGNFNAMNGGDVINDTQDPTKMTLFGTSQCTSIILKNSSNFYGAIYAPYALLDIRSSADMYGSFVGDSAIIHNSVQFHYDIALQNVDPDDIGVGFVPTRWHEE
ncbi:MAG: collagen-binding domain-containing protein [Gammaproteobacteria bacterium]